MRWLLILCLQVRKGKETDAAVPLSSPFCSVWDPNLWDAAATFRVGHSSVKLLKTPHSHDQRYMP